MNTRNLGINKASVKQIHSSQSVLWRPHASGKYVESKNTGDATTKAKHQKWNTETQ